MPGGNFQPAKLDVESGILDSNLKIINDSDPLDSLFPGLAQPKKNALDSLVPQSEYQTTQVVPKPGLCVKTKNAVGTKFFINICKLAEIPPPPPIDESELAKMIESEDYSNLWRVPMSLGAPRKEKDKSGTECMAAEVAVNSSWFDNTMLTSELFTSFVITIAIEGLGDKYGEEARLDRDGWTILKNKKFLGDKCPAHNIQVRPKAGIENIEMSEVRPGEVKSEEFLGKSSKIQEISSSSAVESVKVKTREPRYKILKEPHTDPAQLRCKFWLPGVMSSRDLSLEVGEDRIVLDCSRTKHYLDIFLPCSLDNESVGAVFTLDEQLLTVTIALLQG